MSIGAAFANALSGLAAASRRTDVISGNVANAMTEGYARRETMLAAGTLGGRGAGVRVVSVRRVEDPRATADRREAEAAAGRAGVEAEAEARLLAAFGDHASPGGLPSLSTSFEISLRALADAPESESLQVSALLAAKDLVLGLNRASLETARLRMDADAAIAREVETVNGALKRIEALNGEIRAEQANGGRMAALEEERQRHVDRISSVVPVRTVQREGGALALFTANGAVLLDGRASELAFEPTGVITADMTLSGGALSGLSLDGRPVRIGAADAGGPLDGGSLGARFRVRDAIGPAAHAQLDAFAADVMQRFEDPAADPTIAPGDPGLFTDRGAPYDPTDRTGLAGRLQLNALADPERGGEPRRLRDGLYGATPGPAGEDDTLRRLLANLTDARPTLPETGVAAALGVADLAGAISSVRAGAANASEAAETMASARHRIFAETEAARTGVDMDAELSRLLLVEEAYAANARVLQVIESLARRLMEI